MPRIRTRDVGWLLAVAFASLALATVAIVLLQAIGVSNASIVYIAAVVVIAIVAGTSGAVLGAVASFLLPEHAGQPFDRARDLKEALDDAVDLGADVVRVEAADVATGLEQVARSRHATHLVLPHRGALEGWDASVSGR